MTALVQTENITKDFPAGDTKVRVLDDITVDVNAGELTMLIGPSGCGKTTLLSVMTGILTPTSGRVVIDGTNLTALRDKEKVLFRRERLGFVFQQFNLLPALTAAENAAVPLIAAGLPFEEAITRANTVLAEIGMGKHTMKKPNQLSGGQQQRVAFARALVHRPRVLVCDEPTSALDATSGQQVMEILRSVALQPDCAVIVVTHDNRIYHFADRMIHMSDGQIERTETRGETHENA
jgi:putative ABC transport system ATP-binding protein